MLHPMALAPHSTAKGIAPAASKDETATCAARLKHFYP